MASVVRLAWIGKAWAPLLAYLVTIVAAPGCWPPRRLKNSLPALAQRGGAVTVPRPSLPHPNSMSLTHRFLRTTRTVHLYLGVFTAPMLLFFAITGGLQTFSLHETTRGSSYAPPAWLASAAQFHKKQTTVLPSRRRSSSQATTGAPPAQAGVEARVLSGVGAPVKKNLLPMKTFFALVALGLFISVLSGLYMAWRYSRKPALFGTILGAGIVVPLLLLLF